MTPLVLALALSLSADGGAVQTTATSVFTFSPAQFVSDAGARAIVAGDFDLDGSPDFATANAGSNTVDVFLNREFTGGATVTLRFTGKSLWHFMTVPWE